MRAPIIPLAVRRQPDAPEFFVDDWLFIKQIPLKEREVCEQHVHTYDHVSMVAVGAVCYWIDDAFKGSVTAPAPIVIRAGQKHTVLATTDALLYCVHNLRVEGYPATREGG